MASNPYYCRFASFPRYDLARGDTVQREFDAVHVGFDRIDAAVSAGTSSATALEQRITALEQAVCGITSVSAVNHGIAIHSRGFTPVHASATGVITLASTAAGDNTATAYAINAADADTLELMTEGFLDIAAGHGLDVGKTYFLDQTPNTLIDTETPGEISQPVCEVWSASLLRLFSHRPIRI